MGTSAMTKYGQFQNLQYNVFIIGWLGIIISAMVLMCSIFTMHWQPELELLLNNITMTTDLREQHIISNFLSEFSSILYGVSLLNIVASLFLLIGVVRSSSGLLFPWLLLHAVLFVTTLYMGIFLVAAGLYVDLKNFVFYFMIFALVMIIFFKIYNEVLLLFKMLSSNEEMVSRMDLEAARCMPYQAVYIPKLENISNVC